MLARIGPVKPFLGKYLIAHSEACGRAEDEPPTRSRCARAATQAPRRRRARPREGDAQNSERGQRGDRRRHAAGEAVLGEVPAPHRARSARASRPGHRTGAGAAYSVTSLVSAVMLARIGPVKPFLGKYLIAHSEACGRAEDGPPTRSRCDACDASVGARPREGDAQVRERGQHGERRRCAAGEAVETEGPAPQRACSACASRPGDRTGGGAAYRSASLVSAVMLARIGPVKPFLLKNLIVHSEACGRAEDEPPTRSRTLAQGMRRVGGEPSRAKGAHMDESAVSAEIVGGTLPEKRFSKRFLRRSVPVRPARVGRESARAPARRTA
jgi:hypothetical protein